MFGNVESSGETSGCRQASRCCWAGSAKRDRRTGVSQEAVGGLQLEGGGGWGGINLDLCGWLEACPPKAVGRLETSPETDVQCGKKVLDTHGG